MYCSNAICHSIISRSKDLSFIAGRELVHQVDHLGGETVRAVLEGEGANRKRSPRFQHWQDEDRVGSDVDVEAHLR